MMGTYVFGFQMRLAIYPCSWPWCSLAGLNRFLKLNRMNLNWGIKTTFIWSSWDPQPCYCSWLGLTGQARGTHPARQVQCSRASGVVGVFPSRSPSVSLSKVIESLLTLFIYRHDPFEIAGAFISAFISLPFNVNLTPFPISFKALY